MNTLENFYRIAWQPGLFMTEPWWQALDLKPWQTCYTHHISARRFIDKEIVTRRQFPPPNILESPFTETDQHFINILDTLNIRLCALGLWRLGHPEYFLLKEYRQTLTHYFGAHLLEQIMHLCPDKTISGFHVNDTLYSPEQLVSKAIEKGTKLIPYLGVSETFLKLCEILFAPDCFTQESKNVASEKLKNHTQHCFKILEKWL